MNIDEIIAAWNAQADYMNSWQHLGEDEKLEWAMKLEREACAKECERMMMYPNAKQEAAAHQNVWAAAKAIRARGTT